MLDGQNKGNCASRVMAHHFNALKLKGRPEGQCNHARLVLEIAVEAVGHNPRELLLMQRRKKSKVLRIVTKLNLNRGQNPSLLVTL